MQWISMNIKVTVQCHIPSCFGIFVCFHVVLHSRLNSSLNSTRYKRFIGLVRKFYVFSIKSLADRISMSFLSVSSTILPNLELCCGSH